MEDSHASSGKYELYGSRIADDLIQDYLHVAGVSSESQVAVMLRGITAGTTVICIDGSHKSIMVSTRHLAKRAIEQPQSEQVIRGPREGYIEDLDTNLALLREGSPQLI